MEGARSAREAIERELGTGVELKTADALNYAEFLSSLALEELRDCARAKEMVESYELREAFRGRADAEAILKDIEEACP